MVVPCKAGTVTGAIACNDAVINRRSSSPSQPGTRPNPRRRFALASVVNREGSEPTFFKSSMDMLQRLRDSL
jgi:hypothetical protein